MRGRRPLPTPDEHGNAVEITSLRGGHHAVGESDSGQTAEVLLVQHLDVGAGQPDGISGGDETIGLADRDVPVEQSLIEQVEVGVGPRLALTWEPVDQASEERASAQGGGEPVIRR